MKIKIQQVRKDEEFTVPARSFEGDAGFDLAASMHSVIQPRQFAQVPTNVALALPAGYWALLVGRSSTFHKRRLIVNPGIIDNGFRGEINALVYNPSTSRQAIMPGDRLFQLILLPLFDAPVTLEAVDELPASARGKAGYGSTGGYQD